MFPQPGLQVAGSDAAAERTFVVLPYGYA